MSAQSRCRAPLAGALVLLPMQMALAQETESRPSVSLTARLSVESVASDAEPRRDAGIREARAGIDLGTEDTWQARFAYDFAPDSRGWRNAWWQYRLGARSLLRLGNQNTGLGLDESSQGETSAFMERPIARALAPGRLTGAMLQHWNDFYTVRLGLFADRELENLPDRRGADGREVIARAVVRPRGNTPDRVALGATMAIREVAAGSAVRIRGSSDSDLVPLAIASTGTIVDAERLVAVGAEAAWSIGSAVLAAEHLSLSIERRGQPSLHQSGWNAWAAWVLTGQRRAYRAGSASFGGVDPGKWPGAVEVGVRVSGIELEAPTGSGGRQMNTLLALNWYPHEAVRLMLEYGRTDGRSAGGESVTGEQLVQLRFQSNYGDGSE
jgi:phosphate-selective porin OprO and OprP